MRIGPLIAGIILLIVAIIGFTSASNSVSEGQTLTGQIGRTFIPEQTQSYDEAQYSQFGFGGLGVIGLGLLIYGAVATHKITYTCLICNYMATDKFDLRSHFQRNHKKEKKIKESKDNVVPPEKNDVYYLGLLKERLAKGELTKEEYDDLKKEFET